MAGLLRHWRSVGGMVLGALCIAVGGRLEMTLPGTDVPQTAQTLAVVVVGVALGPFLAGMTAVMYIVLGVFGLPVFAGGGSGPGVLVGPTAGYLVGFVLAAVLAGFWSRSRFGDRIDRAFVGMLLAHIAILLPGWLRLAVTLGPGDAYTAGVHPFWIGAVVKSLIAAVVCWVATKRKSRPDRAGSS